MSNRRSPTRPQLNHIENNEHEIRSSPTSERRRRLNLILSQKQDLEPIPDLLSPTMSTASSSTLISPTMLRTPAVSTRSSISISATERVRRNNLDLRISRYSQYKQDSPERLPQSNTNNEISTQQQHRQSSETSSSPEKDLVSTPTRRGASNMSRLGHHVDRTRRGLLNRSKYRIEEDNIFRDD